MTTDEARAIVELALRVVSQDAPAGVHRLSELQGYSVFDVDTALKLQIAEEFITTRGDDEMEAAFEETLKSYAGFGSGLLGTFVPDEEVDALERLPRNSSERIIMRAKLMTRSISASYPESERWLSLENTNSFADYCEHIGADDPLFWQKVYTRLGLQYPPHEVGQQPCAPDTVKD